MSAPARLETSTSGLPVIRDQSEVSSCSLPRTTSHPFRKAKVGQGNNGYKNIEEFLPEAAE